MASEHMPADADPAARDVSPARLNPQRLSLAAASQMLTRLGGAAVSEAMLRADIAAGAPANADGTINLVHYAAWLVRAMADGTEATTHGP